MAYDVDSYTKLLIHFDGTDGDTADQTAATGQTVSLEGNAQLDTAQKKFGTASLLCDGTGDYATVPDHADWYFAAAPFTIDCWVRFNSLSVMNMIASQYVDTANRWYFWHHSTAGKLRFDVLNAAGSEIGVYCDWSPTINTWYHVEFSRSGTNAYMFVNGVSKTVIQDIPFSTNEVPNLAADLQIGALYGTSCFNGWIDELRISKGIARHTTDFTPLSESNFLGLF